MGVHNLFQIGDKVFYPLHGAGIINAIEEKEVLGKIEEYYVIHIPISRMDVMIPIGRIQKSGIRSITEKDMMKEILDEFHHDEIGDSLPWKERYLLNM